jgi:hypothetical protein
MDLGAVEISNISSAFPVDASKAHLRVTLVKIECNMNNHFRFLAQLQLFKFQFKFFSGLHYPNFLIYILESYQTYHQSLYFLITKVFLRTCY